MAGRIFERKRRQMPCVITLDGRNHGGLILDVSPGGLYIQSSAKMKPGDQVDVHMTIPGIEGRHQLQVEVVRKVIVPTQLLKVAHGGVGVRIVNAPEAYYQFMDELGVTTDAGTSKLEQLESRRAKAASAPSGAADPKPAAGAKPEADREPAASRDPEASRSRDAAPSSAPEFEARASVAQRMFRVRIKQAQGPRSRTLNVEAESEEDARRQALHAAGAGWILLGVERANTD